ncbi:MAG TPA: prenyltransferase/squalene oxidase repeat-containing protein, partial [bacterium]
YLARVQGPDGYWGDTEAFDEKYGQMAVGKTGLCLLAFLGASHTPASGSQYSENTDRAVRALLAGQDAETGHFGDTTSYSHAIATYALAECYALTDDSRLRAPLQRAVDWIVRHQHMQDDVRFKGGWGYYYPDGRSYDPWPRTSVTVWQVMALESARVGGLRVPDRTFTDARTFLVNAYDKSRGVVLYSHAPARLNSAYATLPGSTPAGLFALSLLGKDLGAGEYDRAISWVLDKAPAGFREGDMDAFVNEAKGNLYFWYYSTLALFRVGGDSWEHWNRRLQDTLLPAQSQDGSWKPISLYARFAGDTEADRSYTTAMCVLSLEVYYRYFTPLLQVR